MKTPNIILSVGVKALIINKRGEYLVLKRTHPYEGESEPRWDVPGGRINPGEPTQEAVKREVREETNLEVTSINKILAAQDILRVPGKHLVRITYLVSVKLGEVVLDPNEHTQYQWIKLSDFKKYKFDLYLEPVISMLEG